MIKFAKLFFSFFILISLLALPEATHAQVDSVLYKRSLYKQQNFKKYPWQKTRQLVGDTLAPKGEIIYDRIRSIIKVNDPAYYITFPTSNNLKTYPYPHQLREEEGSNGYVLELRLAQRFPILQPNYARSDWFIRTKWFTVNYDFQYRVARHPPTSSDSPGLPLNTKFGFTIIEYMIPLTLKDKGYYKTSRAADPKPFHVNDLGKGRFKKDNIVLMVPRLDFMHYSNGQHDTARYIPPDAPVGTPSIRNNYANGNFSTNYLQGQIDFYTFNRNSQLLNLYAGYRFDFGFKNLLSFEETQEDRYGKQRFIAGGTLRSGPMRAFYMVRDPKYNELMAVYMEGLKSCTSDKEREVYKKKHQEPKKDLNGTLEWYLRLHLECITDATKYLQDYKTGITIQTGLFFTDTQTASIMLQGYYGRDYMNMRYDMPVCNFLIGANFTINGYTAAAAAVAKVSSSKKK